MGNSEQIIQLIKMGEETLSNPNNVGKVCDNFSTTFANGNATFDGEMLDSLITVSRLLKDYNAGSYVEVSRSSLCLMLGALEYVSSLSTFLGDIFGISDQACNTATLTEVVKMLNADIIHYKDWRSFIG